MRRAAFKLIASWFNDLCVPKGFAIRAGPLIGATALVFVPREGMGRCGGRGAAGSPPPARKQPVSSGRPDLRRRCAAGVDTASQCGYMPQCEALEALLPEYRSKGFAVLGFPPEISGDEFDDEKCPRVRRARLWREIPDVREGARVGRPRRAAVQATRSRRCGAPRWDFHRYLIGRDGRLIASFGSGDAPDEGAVVAAIQQALAAPRPARGRRARCARHCPCRGSPRQ